MGAHPTDRDRKFFSNEFDFGYGRGASGLTLAEARASVEEFLGRPLSTPERCQFSAGWWQGKEAHDEYVRLNPEPVEPEPVEPAEVTAQEAA